MDTNKLLDDINKGLQAIAQGQFGFDVAEELPPLPQPDVVGWERDHVQPPGQLYIEADHTVTIAAVSTVASVTFNFTFSILRKDGAVQHFVETLLTSTVGVAVSRQIRVGEGFLFAIHARPTTVGLDIGQAWVQVQLTDPSVAGGMLYQVILRGYCTLSQPVQYPGSDLRLTTEATTAVIPLSIAQPAAGSAWNFVVPTGSVWEIINMTCVLATAVAAATRRCYVLANWSSGEESLLSVSATGQTASLGYEYGASVGQASAYNGGTFVTMTLPAGLYLQAGTTVTFSAENLQAADQFQTCSIAYRERIDI